MRSPIADARVARLVERFESLSPQALAQLDQLYVSDAFFKDPFNEVRGVPAIARVFQHMYDTLDAPRFVVHEAVAQGDQCFLTWDFLFAMRSAPGVEQCVRGASHLRLAADGRIEMHRDYWDAAEELYEKIALLGPLMRWLKRRVAA